jgi:hypothetical protein
MIGGRLYKRVAESGRRVRIYARDGSSRFCIHGAVEYEDGWHQACWDKDGIVGIGSSEDTLVRFRYPHLRPTAKLTQRQADRVRADLAAGKTQSETAKKFKVSQSTVYFIKIGKIYNSKKEKAA